MIDLGDWNERLAPLFADERYQKIRSFLIEEYRNHTVYPDMYDLYNCFKYTQFENLRVVILGQDPYHGEGQEIRYKEDCAEGVHPLYSIRMKLFLIHIYYSSDNSYDIHYRADNCAEHEEADCKESAAEELKGYNRFLVFLLIG